MSKAQVRRRRPKSAANDLRREYRFDYAASSPNRFAERMAGDSVAFVIDHDLAEMFEDSRALNSFLRNVADAFKKTRPEARGKLVKRRANKRLQPAAAKPQRAEVNRARRPSGAVKSKSTRRGARR